MKLTLLAKLLILSVIAGMAATGCNKGKEPFAGKTLTENDSGTSVTLKTGELFRVKLKAQMSTGYGWIVSKKSDTIVAEGKQEIETQQKDQTGGFDYVVMTFRAAKKGDGEMEFHYKRPWEKDAKPEKTWSARFKVE